MLFDYYFRSFASVGGYLSLVVYYFELWVSWFVFTFGFAFPLDFQLRGVVRGLLLMTWFGYGVVKVGFVNVLLCLLGI